MPTLQRFPDCRVLMYVGDHPPPHVHIQKNDGRDCIVEIGTSKITGRIASREIREILAWIGAEQEFLLKEWRRCNP